MRKKLLSVVLDAYRKFAPKGNIDYLPYAEKFLESYIAELKQGPFAAESTFLLINELVRRTFTPREVAAFNGKIMSIALTLSFSDFGSYALIHSKLI